MKKNTTLLILVTLYISIFNAEVFATNYYVSPTGSTSAAGTITAPLSFTTAIAKSLTAGDSVILRGGLYSFNALQQISKSGSAVKYLHIVAYRNEVPVLDFRNQAYNSSNQGVKISGNYVHFKGITVQGAGDNGIQITGSNNFIEFCVARWNCDSGFQLKTGSNNYILNCDSYENFDYESGGTASPDFGGNADGFADKQYTNTGTNTFKGCRSWRNSDDGWDHFEKIGNTVHDSCWCYANGPASFDMTDNIRFKTDSAAWFSKFKNGSGRYVMTNYGNGNGFKLGGNYTANNSVVHHCISVMNKVKGFDQNNNNGTMTIINCTGYKNGNNYGFSNSSYGTLIIKNCASLSSTGSNSFACKSVTQTNNTWNSGFGCTTADFASLDNTQMLNPRQADGSLPEITLLHLVSNSIMIDKGVVLEYGYVGSAPDLGAYEYGNLSPINNVIEQNTNPIIYFSQESKEIHILGEIKSVEIFDISGKRVVSISQTEENQILSGSNLPKGACIVRTKSIDGHITNQKLFIQ
ncbi:MAG: hypothetical protein PHV20_01570 [Bacteroidales bacterium]|nr:hypothetical protein [Bacteroidales bacterium]